LVTVLVIGCVVMRMDYLLFTVADEKQAETNYMYMYIYTYVFIYIYLSTTHMDTNLYVSSVGTATSR